MDQTEYFELCDILHVNFGYMPNNSCNKINITNKIIFLNQAFDMNKQTTFFFLGGGGGGGGGGEHFPISTCLLSRKNIFSTIFYNNPIIYFMPTFSVELKYTI